MRTTLPPIGERRDKTAGTERPKLMVSIVERGKGKAIIGLYSREGVDFHYQTIGRGTATSEIMDILGLDSKEKDVVISLAAESLVNRLVDRMIDELRGVVDTKGILFDLPVTGITNLIARTLNIRLELSGERKEPFSARVFSGPGGEAENVESDEKEGAESMSSEKAHSLILISVNQGYTDHVLDTARSLGARGGTVLRARWSGDRAFEQHHGMTLQMEKEIIAIIVPSDIRNSIMDAVNEQYGLRSEVQAVVCSMKVDHFAPI